MNTANPKFFFIRALEITLKSEGGFIDHPNDSGGPTNMGITIKTLSRFRKKEVTKEDVQSLGKDEAMTIYHELYWLPLRCDKLTQFPVAAAIFDTGVLSGLMVSANKAQIALTTCGYPGITIDGVIGPITIAALNAVSPLAFIKAFHRLLMIRISDIVKLHPKNQVFTQGWENRVDRLLTLVS